jgi:hypothetical protein
MNRKWGRLSALYKTHIRGSEGTLVDVARVVSKEREKVGDEKAER